MNLNRFAVPTLALFLGTTCMVAAWAHGTQQGPPPPGYGQGGNGQQGYGQDRDRRDWDAPPQELNDIQRQGFHDGIEGARKDFDNHRRPDVNNRDEYRNPHLPPEEREAYRDGFRRGYQRAMSHLMGGPGQQMRQPERPWDAPPDEYSEMQRQGFRDGLVGAQKDFDNHRRPDVNNRDEYRHPENIPHEMRAAYRDGFRRGYERGMSHLMGVPEQQLFQSERPWDAPPDEFNEMQRRGFHDGLVGAQRDFDNHRRPDVNHRDEYRDPENIPHDMREAYREGFERGYDAGARHLWGESYEQ